MDDSTLPLTYEATSDLIRQALSLWGMDSWHADVIRHNENLACRVELPKMPAGDSLLAIQNMAERTAAQAPESQGTSQRFLLRICLPKTAGWVGLQQDVDALRSELSWIKALRRDTGLVLQEPIPSLRGKELEFIRHPLTGKDVPCMLLTWLEGDMFNQKESNAEDLAREFGRVQAAFHAQAKSWRAPIGSKRLIYDEDMLMRSLPDLERGVEPGVVRAEDLELAREASVRIADLMRRTPRTPGNWGMIHADWVGNLVVRNKQSIPAISGARPSVVPIDFSLSGFGYYHLDMAIGVSNLKKHLREPYLEGYGIPLDNEDKYRVSGFILMMIFVSAAKNVFNPKWQDWFQSRRLPVIAQEHCRQFLRGESFLLEI